MGRCPAGLLKYSKMCARDPELPASKITQYLAYNMVDCSLDARIFPHPVSMNMPQIGWMYRIALMIFLGERNCQDNAAWLLAA